MRDARLRKERQQRLFLIVGAVVIVAVLGGAIAYNAVQANKTASTFTRITPGSYPSAKGLTLGDPNAKVRIDVFEDFKCSACQSFTLSTEPQVLQQLVDTGQAYYVFHNYPFLDNNAAIKESDLAANAAMCAAEQERFWDFQTLVFTNFNHVVGEYTNQRMEAFADSLGLNSQQFTSCLEANKYQSKINEDIALAEQMNISGTPSVFVNNQPVAPGYAPTFEQIRDAVLAALGGSPTQ